MTPTLICGGSVLCEDGVVRKGDVLVERGKIRRIAPRIPRKGATLMSARGRWVAPGLIDTQINGGFGKTFSTATEGEIAGIGRRLLAHGVTSYLPTLVSLPLDRLIGAIRRIQAVEGGGLGVHLEGPFLNPEMRGAHREEFVRPPSLEEFRALCSSGTLRMMTIAPELPGAFDVIREGRRRGVMMAAGHSRASAEEVRGSGIRHVTHVFNAMAPFHHREETILNAALTLDSVSCGVIYDRRHISAGTARLLARVKPPGSLVLVSDATAALEAPDGPFECDGTRYIVQGGEIRVEGSGRLGGSACSLLHDVRYLMADTNLPLEAVWFMASGAPARLLGIDRKKGFLRPGADADIVLLDRKLEVRSVLIGGELGLER